MAYACVLAAALPSHAWQMLSVPCPCHSAYQGCYNPVSVLFKAACISGLESSLAERVCLAQVQAGQKFRELAHQDGS